MAFRREPHTPSVVITGTSTGIGAACALDLDRRGFRVFAGVRQTADGERLASEASERLVPLVFDVTDSAAIDRAVEAVAAADTGLDGLVNNAGIVVPGPLECLTTAQCRRQLDVNVVGTLAVSRAFLPLLRKAPGRIVNIGSISGKVVPPFLGAYAASKFALEALTDALRLELRRWRIAVSIVEPDRVTTPIWDKLLTTAREQIEDVPPAIRHLYEEDFRSLRRASHRMDKTGMPVQRVVRAVRHALCAKRPKTRYPVGLRTHLAFWAARHLPDRLRDRFMLRALDAS